MNSDQPATVHFAHSLEGRPESQWEPLDQHQRQVADLASQFAGEFNAADCMPQFVGLFRVVCNVSPNAAA